MTYSVKAFGASGEGMRPDTDAINAAIIAAHQAGGGQVTFPAGRYLSFSIRLLSGVTLHLEDEAVLIAADPEIHDGAYEMFEDNPHDLYQDFGHSHWRNSLIWAEDAEHIAITGTGLIDGSAMTREGPGSRWSAQAGEFPLSMRGLSAEVMAELVPELEAMRGHGNKAIALKQCRHVTLSDFTLRNGGHFALLATGVEDMIIENLTVDTNRDGLDIDGCRRVTITGCRVNTPNDDAIVLKSSFALGHLNPCEDITISDCTVSGYDLGTMLDGTKGRTQALSPDQDRVTGRIKIGTESNGDFRRIRISNCRFERSRGLALETVDGGTIEDIEVENLTLSEITTAPIFLRVGARLRGPEGTSVGRICRVTIRNLTATDILPDYCALLMGQPESPIEDVTLENISLAYRGGITMDQIAPFTDDLPRAYPEPSMFGITPAWGLWARHVKNLSLNDIRLENDKPDDREKIIITG